MYIYIYTYIYIYIYIYVAIIKHNTGYLLVDSLSFKLSGSGQYVADRRSSTFQTDGGNSYSSFSGTRVLKFRLNGEGWLDPSTVRVMFDVVSTDPDITNTLKSFGYCHGFFKRLRLSVRGQIIEELSEFNRMSHMLNLFESPQTRFSDTAEGHGYFEDISSLDEAG